MWDCTGFMWQGFGSWEDCEGGFYGKLTGASPMSDRDSSSWLQEGPDASQS